MIPQSLKKSSLIIITCLFLTSCFETVQKYILNPDGSGKVFYTAVMDPNAMTAGIGGALSAMDKSEASPEDTKISFFKDMLTSEGFEAWRDLQIKVQDDGKIVYTGTGYFRDISKIKIGTKGNSANMLKIHPVLIKNDKGQLILEISTDQKINSKEGEPKKLTEKELAEEVKKSKAQLAQMKGIMGAMLGGLKGEYTFQLPGSISTSSNLELAEVNSVKFKISGDDLIKLVDKINNDEVMLKKFIQHDENVNPQYLFNEAVYGSYKPLQAVINSDAKPLFNYAAEVAEAKKNQQETVKYIEKVEAEKEAKYIVSFTEAGSANIKKIKVQNYELNFEQMFDLTLEVELTDSIQSFDQENDIKVNQLLTDKGEDISKKVYVSGNILEDYSDGMNKMVKNKIVLTIRNFPETTQTVTIDGVINLQPSLKGLKNVNDYKIKQVSFKTGIIELNKYKNAGK